MWALSASSRSFNSRSIVGSVRIVIVDALLIERMNLKPDDPFIVLESDRDIADDIFDEGRLVVGLHRHVALVFSF